MVNTATSTGDTAAPDVTATASALIVSAAEKAGMDGVDRAAIDAIILRESGDSNFMKQQRKRDAAVDERIKKMKRRLAERDGSTDGDRWREAEERSLQPELDRLAADRRPLSTCVVVDMDAFYMSCELLSRPDLKDVPACVGRGMILTSNYCARRYGVRSAMAGWIGDKLVQELSNGKERLVHVPSNFELYTEKAREVRKVLAEYDPKLIAYSLDECYMDIGPYLSLRVGKGWTHEQVVAALSQKDKKAEELENDENDSSSKTPAAGIGNEEVESDGDGDSPKKSPADFGNEDLESDEDDGDDNKKGDKCTGLDHLTPDAALEAAAAIVAEMRRKVCKATGGLTCSAGLASNFMLAKIASDRNKPNGQWIIGPSNGSILSFIRPLSVRKVPGIGRVTEKILNAFNIHTVQQLYDQRALVQFLFSKQETANFLLQRSIGWSNSDSKSDDDEESAGQKGISKERTFQSGKTWGEINSKLEEIAYSLSAAMQRKDIWAHTITLKCKLHTFDVLSRSKSMARGAYLQSAQDMIPIVAQILADLKKQHKGSTFNVRLLGIRCSNFREESDARQPDIQAFLTKKVSSTRSSIASPKKPDNKEKEGQPSEPSTTDGSGAKKAAPSSPYRSTASAKISPPRSTSTLRANTTDAAQSPTTAAIPPSSAGMQVTCPICSDPIPGDNNDLNRHVDSCLNASTVRQLAQDESAAADERAKKRRILEDFFHT